MFNLRCLTLVWLGSLVLSMTAQALEVVAGDEVPRYDHDAVEHPASYNTVALMRDYGSGQLRVFCTASIIADNLLLTAKHCLHGRQLNRFKVYFGVDQAEIDPTLLRQPSATGLFGPSENWQLYFPNLDVAWVRFSGGLPNQNGEHPHLPRFRAIEILRDPARLTSGQSVTIAGYGNQLAHPTKIKAGRKLKADIEFDEYLFTPHFFNLMILRGHRGQGACHGDSGGPAYVSFVEDGQKRWYLAGLTNGFDVTLTPDSLQETGDSDFPLMARCDSGQSIYGFAGFFIDWLKTTSGARFEFSPANTAGSFPPIPPQDEFSDFASWCEKVHHSNPAWLSVKELMTLAVKNKAANESDRDIFFNCQRAQEILSSIETIKITEDSSFSTLAPFASLPQLKSIHIQKRPDLQGLDTSPLLKLPHLESLTLRDSQLSDVSFLEPLGAHPSLTQLDLSRNHIRDLTPLTQLQSLQKLNLNNNQISRLQPFLHRQPKALKSLTLAWNRLTSLHGVQKLLHLKSLNISGHPVTDLAPLQALTQLEDLSVRNTQITDLQPLTRLAQLRLIDLSHSPIHNPELLRHFPRLEELRAHGIGLESIHFLSALNELRVVELSRNRIVDLSPFASHPWPQLKRLLLASNHIVDLSPLAHLNADVSLWVGGNPLTTGQIEKTATNCPTTGGPRRLKFICRR